MSERPTILFGAFDRHNFGDLLLAEVAASILSPASPIFAALAQRDLRACGGRETQAIARLAAEWRGAPPDIVHVGGEILTCSLYEAAVMLLPKRQVADAIKRFDADPGAGNAWARQLLGVDHHIAYLLPRPYFPAANFTGFLGIGGATWNAMPACARHETIDSLGRARIIWVREDTTAQALRPHLGVTVAPDPAALVRALFHDRIAERGSRGEPATAKNTFPSGYAAVQLAADWGDDKTLTQVGKQLLALQRQSGLGLVFFRAGSAPWHDDLAVYQRLSSLTSGLVFQLFHSLNIWDICALLAGAKLYCGTSLHGRIVAEAFARAAVNLARDTDAASKQKAYASCWDPTPGASLAAIPDLSERAMDRLREEPSSPERHADRLARLVAEAFRESGAHPERVHRFLV